MRIVIDTTMIFSLLLGKNFKMRDTFFHPQNEFFAPNYVIVEAFEKKEKIMRYSALSEIEIYELLYRIFEKITFITRVFHLARSGLLNPDQTRLTVGFSNPTGAVEAPIYV